MIEVIQLLAQGDVAITSLYTYGPMGLVLGWFMLRGEKVIIEIRSLRQCIEGLTRAILVEFVTRDDVGEHVKTYARSEIERMDLESRVAKLEKR